MYRLGLEDATRERDHGLECRWDDHQVSAAGRSGMDQARRQFVQLQARRGGRVAVQDRSCGKLSGYSRQRCLVGASACVFSLVCVVRVWGLVADDRIGRGWRPSFSDELALVSTWTRMQDSTAVSKASLDHNTGAAIRSDATGKLQSETDHDQQTSNKNSTVELTSSVLELRKEQLSAYNSPPRRPARISRLLDKQLRNRSIPQHHDQYIGEAYHSMKAFLYGSREMDRKFKVFVYPHPPGDPFRKIYEAVEYDPSGNYASESYFKKGLMSSHFVTKDPKEADLFYLPFSISGLRNDRRVGVGGIQGFIENYMRKVSTTYPYWNRTGGADHFYVVCHSVGRTAMEKALQVRINAIQVVCSSNYHVRGYVPHKDVPIPQIWPRKGTPVEANSIEQRKILAFFAGGMNSPLRAQVVKTWANDSDILVHSKRISTPYSDALLTSKFCLHVKGYEVNTARIGDAMHYGCVPVVIADFYDLPFSDILDWRQFSVVVRSSDIPRLKAILTAISDEEYLRMHSFVMEIRKHFQWHSPPKEQDAFYTVMYELWLRRHVLRFPLS